MSASHPAAPGSRPATTDATSVPGLLHLRIAAHNGAPVWGGAEIALSTILAGLARRGHDVRFLVARDVVARGARGFGLDPVQLHVGGDVALHHAVRVAMALRRHGSDALIVGTFRKLLHLSLGARLAGVPVVARIGVVHDVPRSAKYRFLFRNLVDRVAVTTDAMREAYLEILPELGSRVVVIPKGLDPPRTTRPRDEMRAALGLGRDTVAVVALARLVEDKRLDRFVDVVAQLPTGTVGLIAGEGPLRFALEARAREHGADIRFLGHVDHVGDVLTAADLMLITSRREAMANAMLEALAAGVPVVSTPVNGTGEALATDDRGQSPGVVARGFEVADLLEAVLPLVGDAELRVRMGRAGRTRARTSFGSGPMLDGWESLLREVSRGRLADRS